LKVGVLWGKLCRSRILGGIKRKLKNNIRMGLKLNRLEGRVLKWFVSGNGKWRVLLTLRSLSGHIERGELLVYLKQEVF